MKPYYRSDDGSIVVYHDRWENVVAAGLVPVREVELIHADPPYGTLVDFCRGGVVDRKRPRAKINGGRVRAFPPCFGDGQPYDPAPILALDRPTILWGSNHYASKLPDSKGAILWDKREDIGSDDGSDGEIAWTNIGGRLVIFRHYWRGALRRTEKEDRHLHVNQKPIALCAYAYQHAKLKRGDLVFVPYLGSGPDLPAAQATGLRVIACDVEEWCCRTAVAARPLAAPHPEPAETIGPLFAR